MGKSDALSRRSNHGTGSDDNSNIVLLIPGIFTICVLEGLQTSGKEQNLLRDIWKGTKERDQEDTITKMVNKL